MYKHLDTAQKNLTQSADEDSKDTRKETGQGPLRPILGKFRATGREKADCTNPGHRRLREWGIKTRAKKRINGWSLSDEYWH